jgi:hypothetical protein
MATPFQFDRPQANAFDPMSALRQMNGSSPLNNLPKLGAVSGENRSQSLLGGQLPNFGGMFPQLQAGRAPTASGAMGGGGMSRGVSMGQMRDAPQPQSQMPHTPIPSWLTQIPSNVPDYQSNVPPWLLQLPGQQPVEPPRDGSSQMTFNRGTAQQPIYQGVRGNIPQTAGAQMAYDPVSKSVKPMNFGENLTQDNRDAMAIAQSMLQSQQQAAAPPPRTSSGNPLIDAYNLAPPPGGGPQTNPDTAGQLQQILAMLGIGGGRNGGQLPAMGGGGMQGGMQGGGLPQQIRPMITTATNPAPIYSGQQMGGAMNALQGMQARAPQMQGAPNQQGHMNSLMQQYGGQAAGAFQDYANPANAQQYNNSYGQAVGQTLGGANYANDVMGSQLGFQGGQRDALLRMLLPMLSQGM